MQDEMMKLVFKVVTQEWTDAKFVPGHTVLDIGAGMEPIGGATHAIDIDPVKAGTVLAPGSLREYVIGDACRMPFKDKSFDRVVSRWAIGPVIDVVDPLACSEVCRVLKDDGLLYIAILERESECVPQLEETIRAVGMHVLYELTGTYVRAFDVSEAVGSKLSIHQLLERIRPRRTNLVEVVICAGKGTIWES